MSGGKFQYDQHRIGDIADRIEYEIRKSGRRKTEKEIKEEGHRPTFWYQEFPEDLYHYKYPDEVIEKFKEAVDILRKAYIYAHRVDWLLSGDDGDENFLKRLQDELDKYERGKLLVQVMDTDEESGLYYEE